MGQFDAIVNTDAAYLDDLKRTFRAGLRVCAADEQQRLDPDRLIALSAPGSVFYVCGPQRLIDALRSVARSSVTRTPRVVRVSSRTPMCASSSLIARVTAGGEMLSLRAAPAKPPVSTTVTKLLIRLRRSALFLKT